MTSPDKELFLWINGLAGHISFADRLMRLLATDYLIPFSLALVLVGLWFGGGEGASRDKNQRAVIVACLGIAFTSLFVQRLSHISPWPRPFLAGHEVTLVFYRPTDPSFPSNVAAVSMAVAVGVWQGGLRRLGLALLGVSLLYSFARVYSGVHYPLDILGGWAVGASTSLGVSWAFVPLFRPVHVRFIRVLRSLHLA